MRLLLINATMSETEAGATGQAERAAALAAQGVEITLLTESPAPAPATVMPRWMHGGLRRWGARALLNFTVARLLMRHRCDVCLIDDAPVWAFWLAPVLALFRVPVVVWCSTPRPVRSRREIYALPAQEAWPKTPPRCVVVGQGIDTARFTLSAREVQPELLYVGPLAAPQRIGLMIETLAYLRAMAPDIPWRLRVVGASQTLRDHIHAHGLMEKVAALGLASQVEFSAPLLPHQQLALYRTALLQFDFNPVGTLSRHALAALAGGCPVLTTDRLLQQQLDLPLELRVTETDPLALAQRINALYANPASLSPETWRARIEQHFALPDFAQRLLNVLNQAAGATPKASS